MSRKIKAPPVNQGRRIHAPEHGGGSTQGELIHFSFKYFRTECVGKCTVQQMASFTERLRRLSGMTWQQVTQTHRHGSGCEKIARAQLKCPVDLTPDIEFVLAFRYDGKLPMLGHRDGATLQLLWVDHDHTVYLRANHAR